MKSLSLFASAAMLLSATSAFALNCATLPSCASLGYNDTVSYCPKSVNGEDLVVKCPFDTTQGKCIYEAAVGQIAYFTKAPNANSGWLLCDGSSYSYTKYPQLAKLIATQFGGTVNNTFMVPDYRGFFLRVYAQGSSSFYVRSDFSTYAQGAINDSFTTPQKEGLPNITGIFSGVGENGQKGNVEKDWPNYVEGAFYRKYVNNSSFGATVRNDGNKDDVFGFSATRSNPIYGAQNGVTPPNMAVYAYIYAGKVVK